MLIHRVGISILMAAVAGSVRTNHTVDDENGDSLSGIKPVYSPPNAWKQGSQCTLGCAVQVDGNSTVDRTWHYATYLAEAPLPYSMTVQFKGTAVYAYNVIANNVPSDISADTNLTFYIDNDYVGRYIHIPLPDTMAVQYDVMVYMNQSLPHELHTFTMQATGPKRSLVLFDYIVYTTEDIEDHDAAPPSVPSTSDPSHSAIEPEAITYHKRAFYGILGAIGGLVVLLVIVVVGIRYRLHTFHVLHDLCRRLFQHLRGRHAERSRDESPEPSTPEAASFYAKSDIEQPTNTTLLYMTPKGAVIVGPAPERPGRLPLSSAVLPASLANSSTNEPRPLTCPYQKRPSEGDHQPAESSIRTPLLASDPSQGRTDSTADTGQCDNFQRGASLQTQFTQQMPMEPPPQYQETMAH